MRLNIFSVPKSEVEALESKLQASRMDFLEEVDYNGWHGVFYYFSHPTPGRVAWAEAYRSFFQGQSLPENRTYFAAFLLTKGSSCCALSYGKAHFYIRPYSDYDFGMSLPSASRMRQTCARRPRGDSSAGGKRIHAAMPQTLRSTSRAVNPLISLGRYHSRPSGDLRQDRQQVRHICLGFTRH